MIARVSVMLWVALATPPGFCDQLRSFVRRYGEERTVEIAKALGHGEIEIAAARRLCFPKREQPSARPAR